MINNMKHTFGLFAVVFVLLFSSCDSWLNVEPMDSMSEDKVFSSKEGFTKAINGIYLDMVSNQLYGLASTLPEVLAQRYYISDGHTFQKWAEYTYTETNVKNGILQIWKQNYTEIANCNQILQKLEEKKEMLGETVYRLMKGEVLGLRALLHFDMLRLFAPAYDEQDRRVYVPYYDEVRVEGKPLVSSAKFVDYLLEDLDNAEILLKQDQLLRGLTAYPNLRFNYYAVKLVQARVHQWRGTSSSRNKAFQIATSVINDAAFADQLFPFVTEEKAEGGGDYSGNPDRIFYSEMIFGLQDNNRKDLFEDYFQSSLNLSSILAQDATIVNKLYSSTNDYRNRKMWGDIIKNDKVLKVLQKYDEITDRNNPLRTLCIKILGRGEFYLIAADCASSEIVACQYLNQLQQARGYQDNELTRASGDVKSAIRAEYSRELYGEGQYFYYLKKQKVATLGKGDGSGSITDMEKHYVLPLPEEETK